jgi:hypothetical protein
MRRSTTIGAMFLVAMAATLPAQWLNIKDKSIPRNKDGSANMAAPTPRRADGKPDLTGIWNPEPPKVRDVTAGLRPEEVQMLPGAEKLFDQRKTGDLSDQDPDANCLPQGVPKLNSVPNPFRIFQELGVVVILYEAFGQFRQLYMDGRELPANPNPQWNGYSVASWDGDTLVVDSSGFNGKAWLDQVGHPSTEALRVTERFRRRDFGHMEVTATINDPGAYKTPWSYTQLLTLLPDTDLLEFICNENNKDLPHLKGK